MEETLRWLRNVLGIGDKRLPNILLISDPSGVKEKSGCL